MNSSNELGTILLDIITPSVFLLNKKMQIQESNRSFNKMFSLPVEDDNNRKNSLVYGNVMGCAYVANKDIRCGKSPSCNNCILRSTIAHVFLKKEDVSDVFEREFFIDGKFQFKSFHISAKHCIVNGEDMAVVVFDDITELQAHKRTLEKSIKHLSDLNEYKNYFLGVAAHDLRNPIGTIQMYTEVLRSQLSMMEQAKRDEYLSRILSSSAFSLRLLNDLLDISKIESGQMDIEYKSIDVQNFVEGIVEKNGMIARKKDIDVQIGEMKAFQLNCDQNKMEQVLNNLLSNAIKYSEKGTQVSVHAKEIGKEIQFSVSDQGQGIPKDEIDKLFKEFGLTSVQSTAGEKSTGLGLSICKKIVESHGGKIWVDSEVGQGSEFIFTIPKSPINIAREAS